MKCRGLGLFTVLLLVLSALPVCATSLWSDGAGDIYQDKVQEFDVGDIITVVIEEDADATQSSNTNLSQDSSISGGTGIGFLDFLNPFSYKYSDDDNSDGETQRSGQLEADITTLVVEKNPNGTLKIVGNKRVKINGEEQIISLTGLVRSEDVDEDDNTISSKNIANARIEFEGEGVIAAKENPNIFQRVLNWIF